MAADPWTLFSSCQSVPTRSSVPVPTRRAHDWWQRCLWCSWWDVVTGDMSGPFCERSLVMVPGVGGRSSPSHAARWVCQHDKTHVWEDSELATHWATWPVGLQVELTPCAPAKRQRKDF